MKDAESGEELAEKQESTAEICIKENKNCGNISAEK